MQPFTVILGVILGSLFSIGFSLAAVLLVFWILRNDHPRFDSELPELFRAAVIFSALAAIAAFSFVGTIKGQWWRYVFLSILWIGLVVAGWYYWPD